MTISCPKCQGKTKVTQTLVDVRSRTCLTCGYSGTTEEIWRNPPEQNVEKPMTRAQQLAYVDSFIREPGKHPSLAAPYGQSPPVEGDPYQQIASTFDPEVVRQNDEKYRAWVAAGRPTDE